MYRCSFDLEKEPTQKQLDEEVDRLEEQLRRHIETKYGCDDLRRPREALRRLFDTFDADGSKLVGPREFKDALAMLNFVDKDRAMDAMFDRYDRDDSGQLSYQEFSDGIWGLVPVPGAAPQCRELTERIADTLRKRSGGGGFRGLSRMFRRMDDNGNKKLDRREMESGLADYGITLSADELEMVMQFFDRDGDGTVSVGEFVRQLRGKMKQWRQQLVQMAFAQLDADGSGVISFEECKAVYRCDRHPDVTSGQKTQEEVLQEFISSWDKDGDGSITFTEFLDYYKDISASIDDDAYFELMIRNAWKLPKSKQKPTGPPAVNACVTFADGRKETIQIEPAAGVDTASVRSVEVALRKQGVSGIAKVSLLG